MTAIALLGAMTAFAPNRLVLHTALAYLDPGSGSFLLQLLAAGVLGALFAARVLWGRVKARLRRKQQESEDEGSGE
jgi:hypothetical protein